MLGSGFLEFKLDYLQTQRLTNGDVISTEEFSAGGYRWRINCYLRGGWIDGNDEHLSLYLQLLSESENVKTIFDAFVVNADGTPFSSGPCAFRSVTVFPTEGSTEWGVQQFMKRSDLELCYLMNGSVTIVCGVVVMCDNTMPVPPPSDLGSHLGHQLDCTLGTDVSFIVGSETFPAHRAVLAARSPVFKAELFAAMAEATMPSITLQDIEPAAFKVMLRFMYTEALPADDELEDSPIEMMILHLLAAADRFALDRLKLLCALKLWENVSVDTVASVLVCAEMYNCPKLKSKCIEFFVVNENFKKVVFTDGFATLLQKFPALAVELRRRVGI